ncbi:MAG: PAS domain-containing protein [Phycisphaerales bacterium]|nr:PAS domain-containing protein [Phycisphaerales bacterium]
MTRMSTPPAPPADRGSDRARPALIGAAVVAAAVIIPSALLGYIWIAAGASLLPVVVSIWIAAWSPARAWPALPVAETASAAPERGEGAERPGPGPIEAQLRDLRAVIDAMDEAVLVTGVTGLAELCNDAAVRLLGRPAERVLARPVDELFTQVDVLGLHASAAGGRAQRGQVRIAGDAGPRVYEVLAAPLRWRGAGPEATGPGPGSGVVMTFKDVTELARAVSLKTDFVANASHEFRTPLSSIKAAVETLADGAAEEPAVRDRFLRMISGNVVRLEEMTRDLLDLSRLESPETPVEMGPVRTAELAETLGEMFEAVCAERKVGLEFEISPALAEVRSDRRLMVLILKNLIDNALKFAYEGTTVRVAAEEWPHAGPRSGVRWRVIDRGVGIPIGSQSRVFERFYQVDLARTGEPARRGTGLGLAIVKHAVKALGGTIAVQSVWKEGTTMTVELPSGGGPAVG